MRSQTSSFYLWLRPAHPDAIQGRDAPATLSYVRQKSPYRCAAEWRLLQLLFRNHVSCPSKAHRIDHQIHLASEVRPAVRASGERRVGLARHHQKTAAKSSAQLDANSPTVVLHQVFPPIDLRLRPIWSLHGTGRPESAPAIRCDPV